MLLKNIRTTLTTYFQSNANTIINPTTALVEEGILDSMGVMELLTFIEKTFHIEFIEEDLTIDNFKNIETIAHLIINKNEDSSQ